MKLHLTNEANLAARLGNENILQKDIEQLHRDIDWRKAQLLPMVCDFGV